MRPMEVLQINTIHGMSIPDWAIGMGIVVAIVMYIAYIFFSWSVYKALKSVPEDKLIFPAWFAWMMLIPFVGYVFHWLLLPFGAPQSFKKHLSDNPEAIKRANTLFGIGLAYVIIPLLIWLHVVNFFLIIASITLWIIYWVKIITFQKRFLNKRHSSTKSI